MLIENFIHSCIFIDLVVLYIIGHIYRGFAFVRNIFSTIMGYFIFMIIFSVSLKVIYCKTEMTSLQVVQP